MIYIFTAVHNSRELTQRYVDMLVTIYNQDFILLIRDDGSTDGTGEYIRSINPDFINYSRGDGNEFWAKSINELFAIAYEDYDIVESDIFIFLDNDVILNEDYFKILSKRNYKNNVYVSQSISIRSGNPLDTAMRIYNNYLCLTKKDSDALGFGCDLDQDSGLIKNFDYCNGRGFAFSPSLISRVGVLDDNKFPQYGADCEFSSRARSNGFEVNLDRLNVLFVDETVTGLSAVYKRLSIREKFCSLYSIRSPNNIAVRLRLVLSIYGITPRLIFSIPVTIIKIIALTFFQSNAALRKDNA